MDSQRWQRVKTIFNEAITLDEPQRTVFIDQTCSKDPGLKAEIHSLLAAYEQAGDFIDHPEEDISLLHDAAQDPYVGQTIEVYKLQSLLAEGGMGRVYLAERTDGEFSQKVAIKLIRHTLHSKYLLQRFHRERQTLSNLQHPYIAQLLGGGTMENGVPYFIMEYVEGTPVDEYCDQAQLTIAQRLTLFRQICAAVQYVHSNLIIHRDIKPSNILITKDGVPKLLDFGIAKILEEDDNKTGDATNTQPWNLTPDFASPEQLQGKPIITAADVYALGVVLYNLLTGRHPYVLKHSSPAEVIRQVCEVTPPRPSQMVRQLAGFKPANKAVAAPAAMAGARKVSPEQWPKKLRGDLDNIVMKAIDHSPERRYTSAEQLSEDISRYLTSLPVMARKDTIGYRMGKFVQRHRISVAASVIVLLSLVGGIIGISWQSQVAAAERDKAQTEASKAEHINAFLVKMLSSADPSKEGQEVKVVEVIDKAAKNLEKELAGEPEVRSSLYTTLGLTYQSLGIYDKAIQQFEHALHTRQAHFGNTHPTTVQSIKNLALAYHYLGEYGPSDSLYALVASTMQASGDTLSVQYAELLNDYGTLYMDMGEYEPSLRNFHRALKLYREHYGEEHRQVAAVMNNMAMAYHYENNLEMAEKYYKDAIAMDKKLLGGESIEMTRLLNNLAFIYLERKQYDETIAYFEESRQMRKKIQGNTHPDYALATYNVGCCYYYIEAYDRGMQLIDSAMAIWANTLAPDHPLFGNAYYWKGKMKNAQGHPEEALALLQRSLAIRSKEGNSNPFLISRTKCEMGRSHLLAGRLAEAKKLLASSFPVLKETAGAESMHVKEVTKIMYDLYTQLNQPALAAQYQGGDS